MSLCCLHTQITAHMQTVLGVSSGSSYFKLIFFLSFTLRKTGSFLEPMQTQQMVCIKHDIDVLPVYFSICNFFSPLAIMALWWYSYIELLK